MRFNHIQKKARTWRLIVETDKLGIFKKTLKVVWTYNALWDIIFQRRGVRKQDVKGNKLLADLTEVNQPLCWMSPAQIIKKFR